VIMTGTDRAELEQQATQLAQAYWDAREDFVFGCETDTVEACVRKAIHSETRPVVLADSGDNPTGGGVGDRADVLEELIKQYAENVIVAGITDAAATDAAFNAGVGSQLTLTLGASLDHSSPQVKGEFEVVFLLDALTAADRQAVLRTGGIDVVVSARRRPYHNISDFTVLQLDPLTADIVVVKSGYLSPELAPIASPNLMALSNGVVDQFVERLPRNRKARKTFPFDPDFSYVPQVQLSARSK
jgi:microcystin degradation protein MlrC